MKKIITLLLLMLMISPTINAQNKKTKKYLKKLDLKIFVKEIDLKNEKFVVYCERCNQSEYTSSREAYWEAALFKNGLDVTDYVMKSSYKDGNNREVEISKRLEARGKYLLIEQTRSRIIIQDVINHSVVATIEYDFKFMSEKVKKDLGVDSFADFIIKELIKKVNDL